LTKAQLEELPKDIIKTYLLNRNLKYNKQLDIINSKTSVINSEMPNYFKE